MRRQCAVFRLSGAGSVRLSGGGSDGLVAGERDSAKFRLPRTKTLLNLEMGNVGVEARLCGGLPKRVGEKSCYLPRRCVWNYESGFRVVRAGISELFEMPIVVKVSGS